MMRLQALIGLCGYARAGKDTVGGVLVDSFGFRRFAFADPLKSMALALDPWINTKNGYLLRLSRIVDENGWEDAKSEPEVRRFLQVLGTEAVREHLGQESWVRATELSIANSGAVRVVITDVRFPNEAEWIAKRGGQIWRINRVNEDGSAFDNGISGDHPTEIHVPSLPAHREITACGVDELRTAAWLAAAALDAKEVS